MNKELFAALDLLEKEKGIPKEYMLEKIEAALLAAYKKEQGNNTNVRIVLDPVKEDMRVYQQRTVVEEVENPVTEISLEDAQKLSRRHTLGGIVENELKTKNFRRLSATNAKQVIIQAIREKERSLAIEVYESKREEIITATVLKIDDSDGAVVLATGTSNAVLQKSEQIPGEVFHIDEKVKVFISEVLKNKERGPLVTLSRAHSGLVKRLFELEIPEIQDGVVLVKTVAREAGSRTKIAVMSRDPDVDPVGACIGNHGMRIASIIEELRGEKIDIVKYSDSLEEFVAAALAPAEVRSVTMDGERSCRVIVAPDQLSLAIGKVGQNARLAAHLTGCKIDIKAE
ncbi:MAG: transcription termination/antitermination protein NusA [Ruminococcaceae bacterium]|nr:transcription termination/antitermination protein NusA [Oscillospiraceae bacterium]